jgi:hypothetical protein
MKNKNYLPKILLLVLTLFFINMLTVLVGDNVSSVTVVNMTDYRIDVLTEGKMYQAVEPTYAIVHTTDPKASLEVTAQYTPGQAISGSVTRTIDLPYSSRDETCECDDNGTPECVTYPEEGGSAKWEVRPSDFPGAITGIHSGSVWINDELSAQNVALVAPENFDEFTVSGINWSGSGNSTFYVDDLHVLSYPSPFYLDDFESYNTGSYPSANWVNRFSGESAAVSEAVSHGGAKSFQLVSRPTWARVDAHLLPASPDSVNYEAWVYLDQSGRGAQIGLGVVVSSNTYRTYNAITFGNDNLIHFGGADTSLTFGSWIPKTWYKIRVLCRFNIVAI